MMEEALKVISRELSVVEVMQVFKGEVGPASRLQPCLLKFVQDRLLDGKEPTRERRDGAVGVFLTGCKPALVEAEVGTEGRGGGVSGQGSGCVLDRVQASPGGG